MRVNVPELLNKLGVMISDDHIVYTSGLHGSSYFDKDRIYLEPTAVSVLCEEMGMKIPIGIKADIIAAPAVGGVALSTWLGYHHERQTSRRVKAAFARKADNGNFVFKGSYPDELNGKKVWIVEDVLNTGDSAIKTIEAVRACGGSVLGISVLCNRGGLTAEKLGVQHLEALVTIDAQAWAAEACPLCQDKIPINTKVGHGAKFLAQQ